MRDSLTRRGVGARPGEDGAGGGSVGAGGHLFGQGVAGAEGLIAPDGPAAGEGILISEADIDLGVGLVVAQPAGGTGEVVVGDAQWSRAGVVGEGIEVGTGEEFLGDRVGDAGGGNDVAGKGGAGGGTRTGERIANDGVLGEELGQIAGAPRGGGDAGGSGSGGALLGAFVVEEEEGFVALDGAAEGASEDIAAEGIAPGSRAVGEETVGIEFVVAEKFEDVAVELVGTALEGHDDACAADVAVFAAAVAGDDFDLFEGVDVGLIADAVADGFSGFDAVEQEVVRLFAIAVYLGAAAAALEACGGAHDGGGGADGSGDEQGKVGEIAAVEGDGGELTGVDGVAGGGGFGLEDGSGSADLDGLGEFADLHFEVDAGDLVDFEGEGADG